MIIRAENEDQGGGPIMKYGAWHPVGTASSPRGLKEGLQPYTPEDYE